MIDAVIVTILLIGVPLLMAVAVQAAANEGSYGTCFPKHGFWNL